MIDDDHATREQNLAADAASLRAALEQEKHISACALATCERLRKERDEARAAVAPCCLPGEACKICGTNTDGSPLTTWEEDNAALRAEVERLRTAMLDVARCDGHGDLDDCLECQWLDNEQCAVSGREAPAADGGSDDPE